MKHIRIEQGANGSHSNFTSNRLDPIEGWAIIPDTVDTPNFPFGNVTVEEIDGVQTVTAWEPLPIPQTEPEPAPKPQPTPAELEQRIADIEDVLCEIDMGGAANV